MTPARRKQVGVVVTFAAGAVALLASVLPWVDLVVDGAEPHSFDGTVAATPVAPLGLALLALGAALALTRSVTAMVLAAISALLGVAVGVTGWTRVQDPLAALWAQIAQQTGVTGPAAQALVDDVTLGSGPWVALIAAVLAIAAAGWVAATARSWPAKRSRYDRSTDAKDANPWDVLDAGEDPTEGR